MADGARQPWRPVGAWDGVTPMAAHLGAACRPAGISLEVLDHVAMASITMGDGQAERFAAVAAERWGLAVPGPGRVAFGKGCDLVRSAPTQWLAVARGDGDLDDLQRALDGVAAVTQQGDGRGLLVVGGPAARRMLAKVLAIDLHPSVFKEGHAAATSMAHVAVHIWRHADGLRFVLAVPRTSAASTWTAIVAAASEFGCEVLRPS